MNRLNNRPGKDHRHEESADRQRGGEKDSGQQGLFHAVEPLRAVVEADDRLRALVDAVDRIVGQLQQAEDAPQIASAIAPPLGIGSCFPYWFAWDSNALNMSDAKSIITNIGRPKSKIRPHVGPCSRNSRQWNRNMLVPRMK